MGTWDVDALGNDTAADWAYGLEDQSDFTLVNQSLQKVIIVGTDSDIDADTASEALAAAEAVARAQGNSGFTNAYTETVDAWVKKVGVEPEPSLAKNALVAIDRILAEPSELLELWRDSDDFENWKISVGELRARIRA